MADQTPIPYEKIRLEMADSFKQIQKLLLNHPDRIDDNAKAQFTVLKETFIEKYNVEHAFDGQMTTVYKDFKALKTQAVQKQLKVLFGLIDNGGDEVPYTDQAQKQRASDMFDKRIQQMWNEVVAAKDEEINSALQSFANASPTPIGGEIKKTSEFSLSSTRFVQRSGIDVSTYLNTKSPALITVEPLKAEPSKITAQLAAKPTTASKPKEAATDLPTASGPIPTSAATPAQAVQPVAQPAPAVEILKNKPAPVQPTNGAESTGPADVQPPAPTSHADTTDKTPNSITVATDEEAYDRLHNAGKVPGGDKDDGYALLYYAKKAGIAEDKYPDVAKTLYSVSSADTNKITHANEQFNSGAINKEQFGKVVESTIKSAKKYDVVFENLIKQLSQARKDSFSGNAAESSDAFLNSVHNQLGYESARLVKQLREHHAKSIGELLEKGDVTYFDAEPSSQMLAVLKKADYEKANLKDGVTRETKEKIAKFESQLIEPGWLPKKKDSKTSDLPIK